MILHSLGIQNFKSFGSMQRLRLRPLTLLYGPNSSGKSSILQVLGLWKQSFAHLSTQALPCRLAPRGDIVDLGTYDAMVHGAGADQPLTFEFQVAAVPHPELDMWEENDSGLGTEFVRVSFDRVKAIDADTFTFDGSESPTLNHLLEFADSNSEGAATWILRRMGAMPDDRVHPFLLYCSSEEQAYRSDWGVFRLEGLPLPKGMGCCTEIMLHVEEGGSFRPGYSPFCSPREPVDDRAPMIFIQERAVLSINNLARRIQYLGPLREPPRRYYLLESPTQVGVGTRGEFAPSQLLLTKTRTLEALNSWLEALEIPYFVDVTTLGQRSTGGILSLTLSPRWPKARLPKRRRPIIDPPAPEVDDVAIPRLAPTDVGFGIGQVLPILIQGLLRPSSVIAVEQPELHLHPRLQATLADFFIGTALSEGEFEEWQDQKPHQWIVETHSEALMLRLQRRIREGRISPDDVAVYYVQPPIAENPESCVRELRLDESGEFLDEWPDGFFEEGFRERFGGGS